MYSVLIAGLSVLTVGIAFSSYPKYDLSSQLELEQRGGDPICALPLALVNCDPPITWSYPCSNHNCTSPTGPCETYSVEEKLIANQYQTVRAITPQDPPGTTGFKYLQYVIYCIRYTDCHASTCTSYQSGGVTYYKCTTTTSTSYGDPHAHYQKTEIETQCHEDS
jgi:hypothetical protein